jgi:hypothetical protein
LGIMTTFDPTLSKNSRNILFLIDIPSWFHLFPIANLLLLVIGVGTSLALPHLKDALRWFPTGVVPEEVRRKVNNRIKLNIPKESLGVQIIKPGFIDVRYNTPASENAIAPRRTRTYWLRYDVADENIAHHVQKVLYGTYNLSEARGMHAEAHIVLLTNRTPRAWIRTLKDISSKDIPSQAIYIVASSIRVPEEEVEDFHRLQRVDYRLRHVDQLQQVREFLNEPPLQMNKYNDLAVPENPEKFVMPPKIFWLSLSIASLSLYPLGEGISSLLLLLLHGQMLLSAPIVLISLLSGSMSIALSYQVREFKLSYISVLTLLGLVSIGSVLSGVFSFVSVVNPLILSGGCNSIILPVIVLYRFIVARRMLKEHSPRHTKLFSQQSTFSIPIWHKGLYVYILLLLAIAEIILLSIFPPFH